MPATNQFEGEHFFVRHAGVLMATPFFLVLLVVESADLLFAVDSIPAVLAVTQASFLVYTSYVFAIWGIRALHFLLAGAMKKSHYLKATLSVILGCGHQDASHRRLRDPGRAVARSHRRRVDPCDHRVSGARLPVGHGPFAADNHGFSRIQYERSVQIRVNL